MRGRVFQSRRGQLGGSRMRVEADGQVCVCVCVCVYVCMRVSHFQYNGSLDPEGRNNDSLNC